MTDRRFPKSVYQRGSEPDPRFTLANERTFLAWISTALALTSVGVGLESFALNLQAGFRLAASVILILGGVACALQAWFGWARSEAALREHRPLPPAPLTPLLPTILVIAGVLILLGLLVP